MPDQACEFPAFNASDEVVAKVLRESKTIAVIGLSPKEDRPSHYVSAYMKVQGYKIIPVNPGQTQLLGEPCYKSLLDVPGPVDIVDIFREPSAVPAIVEEAIQKKAKVIWMQLGIVHNEAAQRAKDAGLTVIMNKCIMVEHRNHI
jgi:predicted CoA-binding protein